MSEQSPGGHPENFTTWSAESGTRVDLPSALSDRLRERACSHQPDKTESVHTSHGDAAEWLAAVDHGPPLLGKSDTLVDSLEAVEALRDKKRIGRPRTVSSIAVVNPDLLRGYDPCDAHTLAMRQRYGSGERQNRYTIEVSLDRIMQQIAEAAPLYSEAAGILQSQAQHVAARTPEAKPEDKYTDLYSRSYTDQVFALEAAELLDGDRDVPHAE